MYKQQKIEVLKRLIETRQTAVTQRGNDTLVAQAQQWLAELEGETEGWVKVSDRLPGKGIDVYAARNATPLLYCCHYSGSVWFGYGESQPQNDITHWKPIAPPSE